MNGGQLFNISLYGMSASFVITVPWLLLHPHHFADFVVFQFRNQPFITWHLLIYLHMLITYIKFVTVFFYTLELFVDIGLQYLCN